MRKHIRKAAVATVLAAGAALGGFAATGTAQASEDSGFVDGTGGTHNDWSDEGTLQRGDESNAVALWQTVLVADGAKWKTSGGALRAFTEDDIDGDFNGRTASATRFWQQQNDVRVTGKADRRSFSVADNNLGTVGRRGTVTYDGSFDDARFRRLTVGGVGPQVYFVSFDGSVVAASY
ncbi:peptidoglycan-binding protein [Streptomyces sp. NPDC058371]|uniref:peptidoglycan-binding domain-containing protein n=1 Tax=Streptomyces sp. NPDC058371 TaxID=3346463 RepID=UPI003651098D